MQCEALYSTECIITSFFYSIKTTRRKNFQSKNSFFYVFQMVLLASVKHFPNGVRMKVLRHRTVPKIMETTTQNPWWDYGMYKKFNDKFIQLEIIFSIIQIDSEQKHISLKLNQNSLTNVNVWHNWKLFAIDEKPKILNKWTNLNEFNHSS